MRLILATRIVTGHLTAGLLGLGLAGCGWLGLGEPEPPAASGLPAGVPLDGFCLEAQRVVVRSRVTPALQVHEDLDSFVRSKAAIEPFTVHQYVWYEDAARTRPIMISCKLKSADHLNEALGAQTAGPDGRCQDLNRANYGRIRATVGAAAVERIVFDASETVESPGNPGMTGPDWLRPFQMSYRGPGGDVHVRTKGFRVDWADPRYRQMPERFRGVHYCHFAAPAYLERLIRGEVEPGAIVGEDVIATDRAPAGSAGDHGSAGG